MLVTVTNFCDENTFIMVYKTLRLDFIKGIIPKSRTLKHFLTFLPDAYWPLKSRTCPGKTWRMATLHYAPHFLTVLWIKYNCYSADPTDCDLTCFKKTRSKTPESMFWTFNRHVTSLHANYKSCWCLNCVRGVTTSRYASHLKWKPLIHQFESGQWSPLFFSNNFEKKDKRKLTIDINFSIDK